MPSPHLSPQLSVVVPCYNEAANLGLLHQRVSAAARAAVGDDYEIVLVNDGSRDDSWAVMRDLSARDPRLVAINLSRNHGHQLALTAGLDLCSGREILVIDADLQDPPELLGDMRRAMAEQEADVVYAVRRKRDGETVFKRATAAVFYRLLDRVTDTAIPLDTGDFRLMSRRALDAFLSLPEQARFIRGMVAWVGFRQVPFPYDRHERNAGETNYPLGKMVRLALDAVTGFSTAPLRIASHASVILAGLSLLLLVYIAWGYFEGDPVQGWTSTMLVVTVLSAIQMFVLGMIGEYLGRLYVESKRRPLYLVADVAGQARGSATLGFRAESVPEPGSWRDGVRRRGLVSDAAAPQPVATDLAEPYAASGTASVRIDSPGGIGTRPTR